ncbi:MAG TPA: DUF1553 domain-containing protein [Verrucomicrobiota bacterium]|nr:S-layer protein [Verrucomicrobiales bacterium]HRI15491.1 DUF1553 domain-containing protein [Verrucomicrobiota bacterium]
MIRLFIIVSLFAGGALAAAEPLIVSAQEVPEPTFRNHVQSVLTKSGCNMGACHGAASGKNGFYLSLRGYNDEADWVAITRNAGGRRIMPTDPGRSLLLLKATGTVPHKGGKRFEVGSPEYTTLANWIAAGASAPQNSDPRLTQLEVLPAHARLPAGATKQLQVRAHFSDGRVEDVTRWAKYSSANETVANVGDTGEVKVVGFGEAGVTAWYLSQIAVGFITSPYTNEIPADTFAHLPVRNFIDEQVNAKLQELNLPPSPKTGDAEFLRRAYLDTIGVLPTPDEVRRFLRSSDPQNQNPKSELERRDALIERLLNRPEFVDYWAYKWSDLLLVNSSKLRPAAARAYYAWIRQQVEANRPWNELVRDLVTARGSTFENGAGNFFLLHDDPRGMAETATQAFMGMSVGCAKCHNHPSEKWTNDDYFALANLFSRVRMKNAAGDGERILVGASDGELVQPRTGKPQRPRPLTGVALDFDAVADRRAHLADWLVSPENPYFARSIVNRLWANFYGVGLVEKVDDLRVSNPASNEALLAAAADFLIAQRFDLKALMREILRSETYQRSSQALPNNAADTRFYARYYPRRLMAEVILDAYSQVTGVPTEFKRSTGNGDTFQFAYPSGTRALQLPDSQVASYFLESFGKPDRIQTCECERTAEPSVAQVLHIANGATLNIKLSAKECRASRLLEENVAADRVIEEAYLSALSRYPTDAEKSRLAKLLADAPTAEKRAVLEDTYWALLSSKEFLFNH